MSEATVRASIKTLIESVSNVGLVYDNQPFADTWDLFITRFKTTISSVDMVRGWTISCEAIEATGFVATGGRNTGNQYFYQFRIRGYQSFDYETDTENAFIALAIAVMAALNGGIVSGTVFNADLAQLTSYTPRVFGGVLCHVAEITQIVREQI
jgi:hypothetical protein